MIKIILNSKVKHNRVWLGVLILAPDPVFLLYMSVFLVEYMDEKTCSLRDLNKGGASVPWLRATCAQCSVVEGRLVGLVLLWRAAPSLLVMPEHLHDQQSHDQLPSSFSQRNITWRQSLQRLLSSEKSDIFLTPVNMARLQNSPQAVFHMPSPGQCPSDTLRNWAWYFLCIFKISSLFKNSSVAIKYSNPRLRRTWKRPGRHLTIKRTERH